MRRRMVDRVEAPQRMSMEEAMDGVAREIRDEESQEELEGEWQPGDECFAVVEEGM